MELGELIATGPPQALPDPTDLAIADISLFLEFERELFLYAIKDSASAVDTTASDAEALAAAAAAALTAMAATGLREGLDMEDFGTLGVAPQHLAAATEAMAAAGEEVTMRFSLQEYEAWLERLPAMQAAQRAAAAERAALAAEEAEEEEEAYEEAEEADALLA